MARLSEDLLSCVYRAEIEGIEALVANGVSVGTTDRDGRTALMHAILATPPSMEVISTLIRLGSDINARDKGQSWSALAFAARYCSSEICRLLLDAGADIDAVDAFGNTALWRAAIAAKADNVALLVSRGANLDLANHYGHTAREILEMRNEKNPHGAA
jgi:uncharacterized protein